MGNLTVKSGVMGSSKSANLIQEVYNLEKSGKSVILMKPSSDTKGNDRIVSRFGGEFPRPVDVLLKSDETVISALYRNKILNDNNVFILKDDFPLNDGTHHINSSLAEKIKLYSSINSSIDIIVDKDFIVVDEAQFITPSQARQLFYLSKRSNLEIICYSLFTNFKGEFFPGSETLLALADQRHELSRRCEICTRPAIFNAREVDGKFVSDGEEVVIDGTSQVRYYSLCGDHYYEKVSKGNIEDRQMTYTFIEHKS